MAEGDRRLTEDESPESRGTLDVRTRAIQHLVEQVVLDTEGTVAQRGPLGRITGGGSPRASITMEGPRARVELDVAARWPCDVTGIARAVRDRVLTEAPRMAGVSLRTVDVTIHLLAPDEVPEQPGSRVQ